MSVQTYSHKYMHANIKTHASPPLSWTHTHARAQTSTRACDHMMSCRVYRLRSGDNRFPRAMSLRSLDGTRSISGQMLWAKWTLSSLLWNTCVQCDNDTRTHFAHTWRRDTGREEMYRWTVCIWVTPASLTGCTMANGCTFGIHLRQALTGVMWLVGYLLNYMLPFSSGCSQRDFHALKRPKLESYDTIYVFLKRWPNKTSQSFQSKTSKLITFEPPADYEAPRHPVGLIGKKEGGCVGIREQKDPSLSSKRICSQLIPCSVATAFYFLGRRGVTAAGRGEGGQTIAGEFDGRGCRFQSNL